ncbi:MAG: hypothetical protein CVU48_01000 [Candidatus Cloacimonetes bacterium HGW-Cloacimonetes-1]|jgi:hypothetical protein|nr:MAG: hypothetical protein CVU48_01000 [Candidatus Cloacimonetes bacterium HGW-Cloacimonetes-1]
MKKVLLILITVFAFGALLAVEFDFSGELRERAAMYNNASEKDGGHIDNRMILSMQSQLDPRLDIALKLEIGNIIWGDPGTGGNISTRGINIETLELYLDLKFPSIESHVRVGQQYWGDHRSLILDDQFSGIIFSMDNFMSYKTDFAFIKAVENNRNKKDDFNVFFVNIIAEQPFDSGLLALLGRDQFMKATNITLMPYVVLPIGPAKLDATLFVDYQTTLNQKDRFGIGTALRAEMSMDELEVYGDILVVSEDGLTTVSPYYQSGLYLYSYGSLHDGVGIYWNDDYSAASNSDGYLSAVFGMKYPLMDNMKVFGAIGSVNTFKDSVGVELNAGLEYKLIEDTMKVCPFGALAFPNAGADMNYLLGANLTVNF